MEAINVAERQRFMDGEKLIAIASDDTLSSSCRGPATELYNSLVKSSVKLGNWSRLTPLTRRPICEAFCLAHEWGVFNSSSQSLNRILGANINAQNAFFQ